MPKIDPTHATLHLIWPVLAANRQPVISVSILMTAAAIAPGLVQVPPELASQGAVDLAVSVALILAWVLSETSLAFAVFPAVLTGGVLSGYEALRRAAFPRLVTFVAMQFLLLVLTGIGAAVIPLTALWLGFASSQHLFNGLVYPLLTTASLLALFLFGLALPDIVLTGRLSLRRALRGMGRHPHRMGMGLLLGTGPLWWAADAVVIWSPGSAAGVLTAGGIEALSHIVLTWVAVMLHILGFVTAAITLARIYRAELPPEALLEVGRVSEVFD